MTTATIHRPRVYCASKLRHGFMWRNWRTGLAAIDIISTWHDDPDVIVKEADVDLCRTGWTANRMQILHQADHLLAYGNGYDTLNGTLVEIGMAYALNIPIHLVGNFPWGTWRHSESVFVHDSLDAAVLAIVNYNPPESIAPPQ